MDEALAYELIYDGVKCSVEYTHILTPLEFSELVILFYDYFTSDDSDNIDNSSSDDLENLNKVDDSEARKREKEAFTINKQQFKDALIHLDMEESSLNSNKLIKILEENNNEEMNQFTFKDLCRLAVIAKTSQQNKVTVLNKALAADKTTPFVELHKQAVSRELKVKFVALDIRETSDVGLPVHVTEVCTVI